MQKIALTSKGPYTGCTTLANELAERYGFMHITMSDTLIKDFAQYIGVPFEDVLANKALYRFNLQDHGDWCKFQTDPVWIARCLEPWIEAKDTPVVIEKVRTDEQARTLKYKYGFKLVEVYVPMEERVRRAATFGVTPEKLAKVLDNKVEHGICSCLVDYKIDGSFDPEYNAALITTRKDLTN